MGTLKLRALTADDVEFDLEVHPEDTPIEGNASAIDDETDAETERWIREELESGNDWAWCSVVVKARWQDFEGWDALGCCSYRSEEEFRAPGGYFDDMKANALAHLNEQVSRTAETINLLQEEDACES
ncbi:MAG: hypothetical protein U0793_03480 [Gemmataceae bacterium]